ncbi:hypothetical protein AIIKEEIJ_03874 [Rhodococcus sp. YH1]|nr:hypothetical protein [Rhodococcus sp. YH1]
MEMLNLILPSMKSGRYFWRCSSVPWNAMLVAVNIEVMIAAAKSRLYLAMASQKIAYITGSASRPPYCSGMSNPSQPRSAIFWYASSGNSRASSCLRMYSIPTSRSMKAWTVSCHICCSSVKRKSMSSPGV